MKRITLVLLAIVVGWSVLSSPVGAEATLRQTITSPTGSINGGAVGPGVGTPSNDLTETFDNRSRVFYVAVAQTPAQVPASPDTTPLSRVATEQLENCVARYGVPAEALSALRDEAVAGAVLQCFEAIDETPDCWWCCVLWVAVTPVLIVMTIYATRRYDRRHSDAHRPKKK